jgi:hypothetical protein
LGVDRKNFTYKRKDIVVDEESLKDYITKLKAAKSSW